MNEELKKRIKIHYETIIKYTKKKGYLGLFDYVEEKYEEIKRDFF